MFGFRAEKCPSPPTPTTTLPPPFPQADDLSVCLLYIL